MSRFGPYGANWSLANAQADLLPVLQVASITGVFGVSFLVFGTAAALAVFAASGIAAAADLSWLAEQNNPRHTIVVFPERDFAVDRRTLPTVTSAFRAAAHREQVTIVLGVEQHTTRSDIFNTALVFTPDGGPPSAYQKQRPVAGPEDEVTPGSGELVLRIPGGAVGVAICADLGHPEIGRRYGRAGAQLLVVPALDFVVDDWSQSRVQLLRGVESGFSTVRAARQGYLTIADASGRVTAETRTDDDDQATVSLVRNVSLGSGPTVYARVGDVFSWLCLIISVASSLALIRAQRRRWLARGWPAGGTRET